MPVARKRQTQFQPLASELPLSIPAYRLSEKLYWFNVVHGVETPFEEIYKQVFAWLEKERETN